MAQTHSLDLELASTQYASVADNAPLSVTGSCSFEAWVNLESSPATDTEYGIATKFNSTGNQRSYAFTYLNEGGVFKPRLLVSTDGTTVVDLKVTKTLSTGVWLHMAVTYNAATGTATFYLNGQSLGTATGGPASIFDSTATFAIGVNGNGGFPAAGSYFDGLIKDVRVFSDVRTQTEIVTDAHTQGVSDANLVGEWNLNGVYTDSSGNSNTLTASGSPVFSVDIPWKAPTGVESTDYVLDLESGSSQYASVANTAGEFDVTAGTVEAWVCIETLATTLTYSQGIVSTIIPTTGASVTGFELRQNSGTNVIDFFLGGGNTLVGSTTALKAGVWYHIAATWNTTEAKMYINGRLEATQAWATMGAGEATLYVGNSAITTRYFDGLLKDVRIFSDVRTQAEIVADALATTVSDANLLAEWSLNNVYTDASGNSNTLTASGSPVFRKWANMLAGGLISWWTMDEVSGNRADSHGANTLTDNNTVGSAAGKKSNAADFESTNSEYLSITDASQVGLDIISNFSVSLWFKPESMPGNGVERSFIEKMGVANNSSYRLELAGTAVADEAQLYVYWDALGTGVTYDEFDTTANYLTSADLATWVHLVFVCDVVNETVTTYKNGISATATRRGAAAASAIFNGTSAVTLGAGTGGTSRYLDGLIDETSIYSRTLSYGEVLDLYNAGAAIAYVGAPVSLSISVVDTLTVTESAAAQVVNDISVSDSLTVAESAAAQVVNDISVSDSLAITESTSIEQVHSVSVLETLTATEDVSVMISLFGVNITDIIAIAEDVVVAVAIPGVSILDSLTILEDVNTDVLSYISVLDALSIVEDITVELRNEISVFDTLSIAEQTDVEGRNDISIVDTVSLSENVATTAISDVSVFDALILVEDIGTNTQSSISVFDTLSGTEELIVGTIIYVVVTDVLSVAENLSLDSTRFSPQTPMTRPRGAGNILQPRGFTK